MHKASFAMQSAQSIHATAANAHAQAQPASGMSMHALGIAAEPSWLWSTFVDESSTAIFLVSRDGIVEYANLPARALLSGQPAGNVVGRSLAELLGQDHAAERLMYISNVLESGRAVAMEDMLRGKRLQCVLRPCPPAERGDKATKVIAVAHLSALYAGTQNGYPIVRTRLTDGGRLSGLTAKELEILRLIGLGKTTQDIANTLGRSVKTVEWHRVSLGEKLGVENRVMLARIAIAAGLVGLDDTQEPRFDGKVEAKQPESKQAEVRQAEVRQVANPQTTSAPISKVVPAVPARAKARKI